MEGARQKDEKAVHFSPFAQETKFTPPNYESQDEFVDDAEDDDGESDICSDLDASEQEANYHDLEAMTTETLRMLRTKRSEILMRSTLCSTSSSSQLSQLLDELKANEISIIDAMTREVELKAVQVRAKQSHNGEPRQHP